MKKYNIILILVFLYATFIGQSNYGIYISQSTFGDHKDHSTYTFESPVNNLSDVNMFRGRLNIDIPLYTIESGGYQFPISLHYETNGFKLDETSSWVGLGWELVVPGVIKRNVQGIPDESDYGGFLGQGGDNIFNLLLEGGAEEDIYDTYFADNSYWSPNPILPGSIFGTRVWGNNSQTNDEAYLDLLHITENYFDGMPDIFTFFTGQQSGKFVFDRKGNIHQIPKSNSIIYFTNSTGDWTQSSFTIVDENGIKYIYDVIDIIKTLPQSVLYNQGNYIYEMYRSHIKHQNDNIDPYPSAWHLKKIVLPNNQEITINYELDLLHYKSSSNESYFNSKKPFDNPVAFDSDDPDIYVKVNRSITEIHENKHRIISIEWNGNKIEFNKSKNNREDVWSIEQYCGYALDNIKIIDSDNEVIKTIKLHQSYFGQMDPNKSYWNENTFKRLKLDYITEINKNGKSLPPYSFEYNLDDELPSFYSSSRDLWGYYKKFSNQTRHISKPQYYIYPDDGDNPFFNSIYSIYPRTSHQGSEYLIAGRDMTPYIDDALVYTLNKITYPTGGSDSIKYELNKFRYDGTDVPGPGVRVKKIIKDFSIKDQTPNLITTEYLYTSGDTTTGLVSSLPELFKFDENLYVEVPSSHNDSEGEKLSWSTILFSEVRNQADTEVGYTQVTKQVVNGQNPMKNYKSIYNYDFSGSSYKHEDVYHSGFGDYLYKKPISIIWLEDQISGYGPLDWEWTYLNSRNIRDQNSDLLNPDFDWYRGSLLREEHINSNENLIQSIDYTYQLGSDVDQIFGIKGYNYFLHTLPEGLVIADYGYGYVVTSDGIEYRKIRWGTQCYTSIFKTLSEKTVTEYRDGQSISENYTYEYSVNLPFKNKSKVNKVLKETSDNRLVESYNKYSFDYTEIDCFAQYELDIQASHDQYVLDLELNCLNENLCNDFFNDGRDQCITCINNVYSSYIQSLIADFTDYEQCTENTGNNDDDNANAILKLAANNNLKLIETQNRIIENGDVKLNKGNLTLYDSFSPDLLLPAGFLETNIDEPKINPVESYINTLGDLIYTDYDEKGYIDNYDSHGNLIQYHKDNDILITYLWGYNYAYPIAKIENTSFQDIENILTITGITYSDLQLKSTTELSSIVYNLRNHQSLKDARITSYTYDPLIGMTSETDPNGKVKSYQYDEFNRLENIYNHNGDIVKHFEYNYSDANHDDYFHLSDYDFTVNGTGEDVELVIYTLLDWTVSNYPQWVTISETQGNNTGEITISIGANPSSTPRPGEEITIASGNVEKKVTISQLGNTSLYLDLSTSNGNTFEWDDENATLTIEVNSNITSINVTKEGDWFSISPSSGQNSFNISVICIGNNESTDILNGKVIVSGGGITKEIFIYQDFEHP